MGDEEVEEGKNKLRGKMGVISPWSKDDKGMSMENSNRAERMKTTYHCEQRKWRHSENHKERLLHAFGLQLNHQGQYIAHDNRLGSGASGFELNTASQVIVQSLIDIREDRAEY